MATIAEQLTSLANTKTAIKQAIINKGVQVADDVPFSGYPAKIGEISGGAPATKFGASVDTFIGDVVDGVLQKPAEPTALNFAGVTEIGARVLRYMFYECTSITSVDLSSVQSVGANGLTSAFPNCTNITSVDLSSLTTVDDWGMENAFQGCRGIAGALDLSSLQSVGSFSLSGAFQGCIGITSVDLSSLQSVGGQLGMSRTFDGCTGLTTISFPSLTSVQTNSFGSASYNFVFYNCSNLTEIHFRADMQATIEACTGYADKFGAPATCTIYFDL